MEYLPKDTNTSAFFLSLEKYECKIFMRNTNNISSLYTVLVQKQGAFWISECYERSRRIFDTPVVAERVLQTAQLCQNAVTP